MGLGGILTLHTICRCIQKCNLKLKWETIDQCRAGMPPSSLGRNSRPMRCQWEYVDTSVHKAWVICASAWTITAWHHRHRAWVSRLQAVSFWKCMMHRKEENLQSSLSLFPWREESIYQGVKGVKYQTTESCTAYKWWMLWDMFSLLHTCTVSNCNSIRLFWNQAFLCKLHSWSY